MNDKFKLKDEVSLNLDKDIKINLYEGCDTSKYKYNVVDDAIIYKITDKVFKSLAPELKTTIEDWAVAHRRITDGEAQGPFNKDYAPYMLRIFRCFLDPRIHKITLMFSTQLGKSFMIDTIIGYLIHVRPCPILYVLPNGKFIETYSTTKLKSLLEDTKVLRPLVQKAKPGQAGTKVDMIKFSNGRKKGFLNLVSAGSVSGLSGKTTPKVFMDEVSKFPIDLQNQGSSIDLAERRAGAYEEDVSIVLASSPQYSGSCNIEKNYLEGSQEHYHVPCPHCNEKFVFSTNQLKWDKKEKNGNTIHLTDKTTRIECPHCKGYILDIHKPKMLINGEWIADNPDAPEDHVSFQLGIYYSPWTKFHRVAEQFISKSKTEEGLKAFTNMYEGLPFKPRTDQPSWTIIKNRAEPYPMLVAPRGVCFLTASVDVQTAKGGRLCVAIYGWGRGEECWLIYYGEIHSGSDGLLKWDELDDLLNTPIKTAEGIQVPLLGVAVDSSDGAKTLEVYDYCRPRKGKGYIPIKGSNNATAPVISAGKKQEVDARGNPLKGAIDLYHIGTHIVKSTLYDRLRNNTPGTNGYIHFYSSMDAEFFKMLVSEKLVTTYEKGVPTLKWEKSRQRNEALDTLVYCYALAYRLGIQRISQKKWDALEDKLNNKPITENKETNKEDIIQNNNTNNTNIIKKKKSRINRNGSNFATSWKR